MHTDTYIKIHRYTHTHTQREIQTYTLSFKEIVHYAFIIIEFVPYVCIIHTVLFVGIIALKYRDIIGFMCFSYCGIVILSYINLTVGLCCINEQNSGGRSFIFGKYSCFAKGGNYSQQRDITDKIEQGRQLQTLLFLISSMKKACIVAK